ncbi:MAG: nucleoside phosphorylase [Candidatus Woesearchaeota archaeon]
MGYPNFQNKHLEQALFNPQDYISWNNYLKKDYKKAPKKYIIIYYPKILNYFKRKYKPEKIKLYRLITVYQYKDVGVVCMTGIGSPHATTVIEELIALGGKEFLNIGSAGGLKDFGTYLCKKSIRDEGTSFHYRSPGKFTYPDKKLTKKLKKHLVKNNISFQEATSWTIDAPYRETKAEIQKYKKQNVATVEMESSALFTVAQTRKVKIASAFVVSDY